MYCDYYGFRQKPFNITPDPGFMYLSTQHREAFAHLLYGIDNHVGFISLSGEVGTGKTTVIRTLLGQLAPDKYRTAIVFNPCLSSLKLMQHLNREFGIPCDHDDPAELLQELNRFLLNENAAGRTAVLVIDEAQNLDPAVLEQVRLISNLETERDKLIQIVLVGQPELEKLLSRPELRQLSQRIAVRYRLQPMHLADSSDYIAHRLGVAGRRDGGLFTAGAVKRIYRFSRGFPRVINLVCDRALLLGYTRERLPITGAMADLAVADVRHGEEKRGAWRCLLLPTALLLLVLVAAGGAGGLGRRSVNPAQSPKPAAAPAVPDIGVLIREELGQRSEAESALSAFNALAPLWRLEPPTPGRRSAGNIESLARERKVELLRFSGTVDSLLRLDSPAFLEITPRGVNGKRYLALTGGSRERLAIAPLKGRTTLTVPELESIWSGRCYLPWKNYLDIPVAISPGARGEKISRLQGLLKGAGFYSGRLNGTFDRTTQAAVKAFQADRGVAADGAVGRETLYLLYRSGGGVAIPTLKPAGGRT